MIPKIDSDLGILYCTKFSGCGGKIKVQNEDFVVSEVLSKKCLSKFEDSGYAIYKLKKNSIDTHHAVFSLVLTQVLESLQNMLHRMHHYQLLATRQD